MRKRGIRAVTTNAIAEESGVRVGSIYDYFPNKEAIIAEIYGGKLAQIRAFFDEKSAGIDSQNWRTQIGDLLRASWEYQWSIGFDRTIVDASYYYEDLFHIAREHSILLAKFYARLLARLGSNWKEEALFDLGISLYTLVNSTWSYWRLTASQNDIAIERQIFLTVTLMEPALDGTGE
jgi:AcrR family transcriptional regulator